MYDARRELLTSFIIFIVSVLIGVISAANDPKDVYKRQAHDRLICLSTGKDLDDPTRMLYTKQEWMKTREAKCD